MKNVTSYELHPVDREVSANLNWTRWEHDERAWAEDSALTDYGVHIVLNGIEEHRLMGHVRSAIRDGHVTLRVEVEIELPDVGE